MTTSFPVWSLHMQAESSSPPVSQARSPAFPAAALKEAKDRLRAQGVTAKEWAERHGHSPAFVAKILCGAKKCHFGEGHTIAVKLGLKAAPKAPVPHV